MRAVDVAIDRKVFWVGSARHLVLNCNTDTCFVLVALGFRCMFDDSIDNYDESNCEQSMKTIYCVQCVMKLLTIIMSLKLNISFGYG